MTSHEPCPDCVRHIERAEKAEAALSELVEQCRDAEAALLHLSSTQPKTRIGRRLAGKASGVALARSYVEEALR